jgi:hypothetical protein
MKFLLDLVVVFQLFHDIHYCVMFHLRLWLNIAHSNLQNLFPTMLYLFPTIILRFEPYILSDFTIFK